MNSVFNTKVFLQFALASMLLYVGIAIYLNPNQWMGFVPGFVENFGLSREIALYLHGAGDIVLGLAFLVGKYRFWVGLLGFLWLVSITAVSGSAFWLVTFRDIGLALAALAYSFTEDPNKQKRLL